MSHYYWPQVTDQRDQLSHGVRRPALQTAFEKSDADLDGQLNSAEFAVFIRLLAPQHAVHQADKLQWLLELAGATNSKVSLPQLKKWLKPTQRQVRSTPALGHIGSTKFCFLS